jgi:hypothetical protein
MHPYEGNVSHAFTAISMVEDGEYRNEPIICAFDVTTLVGRKKDDYRERIIIVTDERILYI